MRLENIICVPTEMYEGFGAGTAEFQTTEFFHWDVPFFIEWFDVLAYVTIASLLFDAGYGCDVYPIGWVEELGLGSGHDLKVVEFEGVAQAAPSIVDKQRANTMVRVTVNWPVGEDNIWLFGGNQFTHLYITLLINMCVTVYLGHKHRTCT